MFTTLDVPVEALDRHEQNFIAKIREHGWFGTGVLAEGDLPGFLYTTGFWSNLGFPEIIVFSLRSEIAHAVLWDIFKAVKAGKKPPVGKPADIFANGEGFLFPVGAQHYAEHLGWSRWFYGGDSFPCLQLVWSDPEGVFPWQPGIDPGFTKSQPDLTADGWARSLG